MTFSRLVALAVSTSSLHHHPAVPSKLAVTVDSTRREVVITAGPFLIAPRQPDEMALTMDMDRAMRNGEIEAGRFPWPVTSLFRSVELAVTDSLGHPLPRRLLHHLNLINFDRRQLIYPLAERFIGFGQETEDVSLPRTAGLPLATGQRIGLYVMWDNETGQALQGVSVRLTFHWVPANQQPPALPVMPLIVDAHLVAGGSDGFPVPPGGSVTSVVFTPPISGHLLGATGHLHDHGLWVRLEDAENGKVIVKVDAKRDSTGRVLSMARHLLALRGAGPHLLAGHRYRLSVAYDNPTADTLRDVMGFLYAAYMPDDLKTWPLIDPANPEYLADLASLEPKL
jgi:hypothetical protein